jgi:hypothetical protein
LQHFRKLRRRLLSDQWAVKFLRYLDSLQGCPGVLMAIAGT